MSRPDQPTPRTTSPPDRPRSPSHRPSDLTVTVTHPTATSTVLRVAGELDLATCPRLEAHLVHQICARGTTDVVVDLSELRFLSARGVRTVLRADHDARAHGTTLQLVVTRSRFLRMFTLLGLDRCLSLRPDLATARQHFT